MTSEQVIVVNLSGRGDKDVNTVSELAKRLNRLAD
jgi:tryptophan synthase beta subunit